MDPKFYAETNAMQRRDVEVVLRMYEKELKKGVKPETILDLGCGPGNITCEVVAPSFPDRTRVVGVDKSCAMINYARIHSRSEGIGYHPLDILNDVQMEKFINNHGTFSKVVSFYCLHWIKDHKKALMNIKRLLTDEGECLIMFVAQCPVFVMYEVLVKKPEWAEYMSDFEDFVPSTQKSLQPAEDFSKLMEQAGLKKKSCKLLNQSYTFGTTQDLINCMKSVNPFFCRLPEKKVPDYVKACMTTLSTLSAKPSEESTESEGHTFHYVLLIAHATLGAAE